MAGTVFSKMFIL